MRQQQLVIQMCRVLSADPRAWSCVNGELLAACQEHDKLVIVTAYPISIFTSTAYRTMLYLEDADPRNMRV
jgi:hypothetical protein